MCAGATTGGGFCALGWYFECDGISFPFSEQSTAFPILHNYQVTHLRKQAHCGLAWLGADFKPVFYAFDSPLDSLLPRFWVPLRFYDAKRFERASIAPFTQVNGNKMKDAVVPHAVHSEA